MNDTKYQYAIQNPNGLFYTGRVTPAELWTPAGRDVYTYTELAAYRKKDNFPCFADCTVVKYHD